MSRLFCKGYFLCDPTKRVHCKNNLYYDKVICLTKLYKTQFCINVSNNFSQQINLLMCIIFFILPIIEYYYWSMS